MPTTRTHKSRRNSSSLGGVLAALDANPRRTAAGRRGTTSSSRGKKSQEAGLKQKLPSTPQTPTDQAVHNGDHFFKSPVSNDGGDEASPPPSQEALPATVLVSTIAGSSPPMSRSRLLSPSEEHSVMSDLSMSLLPATPNDENALRPAKSLFSRHRDAESDNDEDSSSSCGADNEESFSDDSSDEESLISEEEISEEESDAEEESIGDDSDMSDSEAEEYVEVDDAMNITEEDEDDEDETSVKIGASKRGRRIQSLDDEYVPDDSGTDTDDDDDLDFDEDEEVTKPRAKAKTVARKPKHQMQSDSVGSQVDVVAELLEDTNLDNDDDDDCIVAEIVEDEDEKDTPEVEALKEYSTACDPTDIGENADSITSHVPDSSVGMDSENEGAFDEEPQEQPGSSPHHSCEHQTAHRDDGEKALIAREILTSPGGETSTVWSDPAALFDSPLVIQEQETSTQETEEEVKNEGFAKQPALTEGYNTVIGKHSQDLETEESSDAQMTERRAASVVSAGSPPVDIAEISDASKARPVGQTFSSTRNTRPKARRIRSEGKIKRGTWSVGAKIGVGSFGIVRVGMNNKTGALMAVKSVELSPIVLKDIRREVDLLKTLSHVNIVRYDGAEMDGTHLHIFQEWVPGGSVTSLLHKFGAFSMTVVRNYLAQIVRGLAYLHENKILHRDIKGGNVLVSDEGIVKLADFGSSRKLAHFQNDMMEKQTMRGTPYFMAPEVFEEKYGSKADVWSVGCVAFQMGTGHPPWKGLKLTNPMSLFRHLCNTEGLPPHDWPTQRHDTAHFLPLLEKCFCRDPTKRPPAEDLLRDPFFTAYVASSDDDQSNGRGLFSPGGESQSTWGSNQPQPLPQISEEPSFLSPPLPRKIKPARQEMISPLPPSPNIDPSEWPSWARERLTNKASPVGRSTRSESSPKRGNDVSMSLMDSLARSEDSSAAAGSMRNLRNPFRKQQQRLSEGSAQPSFGSVSTLDGLEFVSGEVTGYADSGSVGHESTSCS